MDIEREVFDTVIGGIRIRASIEGPQSAPVLMLIHDVFYDRSSWDKLTTSLKHSYRCLSVDLPGFGDSEQPSDKQFDYRIEDYASCCAQLLMAMGIPRCRIAGHGFGALIASSFALKHPELVSHIALVTPIFGNASSLLRGLIPWPEYLGPLLVRQIVGENWFASWMQRQHFLENSSASRAQIRHCYQRLDMPESRSVIERIIYNNRDLRNAVNSIARLQRPTLLIAASSDPIAPPGAIAQLSRDIGHVGFELIDGSHALLIEQAHFLGQKLSRFYEDQRERG